MPRARKSAVKAATRKPTVKAGSRKSAAVKTSTNATAKKSTRASSKFKCPECGKTFSRAAALGAHRNRAHGVAGSSSQAQASAQRRAMGRRSTIRALRGSSGGIKVDRDALLQMLFPSGVPAREEVIRSVNGWLDEAERLSRL